MSDDLIEKLARIPQFYMPSLNHSKDEIAFYWDITGRIELYVMNLSSGDYKQISNGEVPRALRSGYLWTRDNKGIIFAKDKDGDEKHDLYLLNLTTKEIEQLTNTPSFQEHVAHSSPDGKQLLFRSTRNGQMNLFSLDFETKEIKELTNYPRPVIGALWSPQNDFIVFGYNDTENFQNGDIWIMEPDGSNQRKLLSLKIGSRDGVTDISEDGKLLAVTSDFEGNSRAGVYNLDTDEIKWFGDGKYQEYSGKLSKNSEFLVCIRNSKATISPLIYDLDSGKVRILDFPPGIAAGNAITRNDESLMVTLNSSTSPSKLIKYDLNEDKIEELIPSHLGDLDLDFFITDDYVEYPSTDNLTIGAVLYKPKNIEMGKKLPALVQVHGGPTSQYLRNFSMFDQILVNNGFVILKPNFRGSTGYGRDFQDLNVEDIGGGDFEDVVAGVDYLKTLDYVDSSRIGIFGGSYGGYMTFWATVKKPDIWKAGAASVGITDWKLLYDESMPHFKYYLHMMFGKPDEKGDLYKERSPIHFVENLKTPLLIVHGTHDPRCPITQARIYKDKMLELGWKEGTEGEKAFEYVEHTDIGHGGFTDQEFRIRSFKTILDFFKRRL
ncbi:MAG: S9 family peptidase [Candidatus Heimdallarchaeota archaeon]|nr:S9 family peptidase [Candidatus Heimdallarchaeota archaeon]